MTALATSEDLRLFLGADEIDGARAEFMLAGVSAEVCRFAKDLAGLVTDEIVTIDGSGTGILLLPSMAVSEVTTVTESGVELVEETDFTWSAKGMLQRLVGVWPKRFRNVIVTYSHGYETIPAEVALLVVRMAARGYLNPTATTNESMGGYSVGYGYDASRQLALTDADKDILREYSFR